MLTKNAFQPCVTKCAPPLPSLFSSTANERSTNKQNQISARRFLAPNAEKHLIFTSLSSMVAIRKTCGAGGQNRAQLQPTNRRTSWSGESSTPGLGRQTVSELSSVCVNDGVWDDGVCIDYRICLMGHNSLQGCQRSVMPSNCKLRNPHKSTHTTHKAVEGSVAVCAAVILTPAQWHRQEHQHLKNLLLFL